MKLITLLCVCLFITTGTWAYSSDCAKGPEYWCRDASTANDCGAVRHCEQTVWREQGNSQKPTTTSETAQMLCNVLVQASTELLAGSPMDVNSIKQFLRQDCSRLPSKNDLIEQCELAVDIYLADILRHIESGTETTKICPIIQGHDTPSAFISKPKPTGITPNQTCVLCEFVIHLLQTFASANSTAQELAQILENVCKVMPAVLRDECKSFVDTYGNDLIAILAREFDPAKTCELIKVCPKPKNVAFLTKPNEQTCGLCDYVSTYLSAGYPIENVCNHFSTNQNARQQCEVLVHLYKPNFCSQLPLCFDDVVLQPLEQPTETTINSAECSLCKYVVSYIDAVVQNNKSAAAIEAALEKVCSILPASLKPKCVTFVNTTGPILLQLIEKYGTPVKVCNALKACNNGTQDLVPLKPKIGTIECSLCKYVISYIDNVIQDNKSAAAIDYALEQVCSILPEALKAKCVKFVDTYGVLLVPLIIRYKTPEQVCNALKACNNGTQAITPVEFARPFKVDKSSVKSAECSLCKYVVSYIDAVVQNNKSAAAIEAALEKVCSILPASLKPKCVTFVNTTGPILLQLIEKYGTPVKVCNALKACNNGTQELVPLKPKIGTIECSLCKYVISYVENVIQDNKSAAAIDYALEQVCSILPEALKAKCVKFVDTYGVLLVPLIIRYKTPEQVCNALKACNNGTQENSSLGVIQMLKAKQPSINSAECSLCKYVVSYIDAVVQNNKSVAAIEAALEKVCSILPAALKTKCVEFVDTYGPSLVKLIEKYGTPDKVCNALKACNNGTQVAEPKSRNIVETIKTIKGGVECTLCKYVLSFLNVLITNNSTEQEIEKALNEVCLILPAQYHTQCSGFVHQYGPVLTELIAELDDPNVVCEWLSLCSKSETKFIEIPTKKLRSLPCNLCEYAVNYLDAIIQSNSTETKFEEDLDKACKILPEEKLQAECQTLVHIYGGDLIKLLVEYGNPKAVCQAIGICDK